MQGDCNASFTAKAGIYNLALLMASLIQRRKLMAGNL